MSINKLLSLFILLILVACKQAPDRPDPILEEGYEPTTSTSVTPPTTSEPAQNAAGVWHYTCPNGCAGGAGSAVPCSTCGTTLAHNTEYHNSTTSTTATTTTPTPGTVTTTPPTTTPPKTTEPAQNAAGVWHYTCPNGCAGGGASATACGSCGTTLVHNSDYHK